MVVDVFVVKRDPEDALRQEIAHGVLDPRRIALVVEGVRERLDDLRALIRLLEQQHAAVGGDVPAVEAGSDIAPSWTPGDQLPSRTHCRHMTVWLLSQKPCKQLPVRSDPVVRLAVLGERLGWCHNLYRLLAAASSSASLPRTVAIENGR